MAVHLAGRLYSVVFAGLLFLTIPTSGIALTDPTRPFGWSDTAHAPENLVLSEIMLRNQQAWAVINGAVVKTGDVIAGYIVTNIRPNAVYLLNANGSVILPLTQHIVRQEVWR